MFDGVLPGVADLAALDDAALVDAVGALARAENTVCARKLAVMAEMFTRRTGLAAAADRESWWVDPQSAVAAEMSAAVHVSQGMALHQIHRAVALRDRLPMVAALFEAGLVSDLLVRLIVGRTFLITDAEAMAAVDAALAQRVSRWGVLSQAKSEAAIDALVDEHDPAALRRCRESAASTTVQFGSPTDVPGTTSMWARLYSPDAALLEQRIEEMAHSVCEADPRTLEERRAAALSALGRGTNLACGCGQPDCAAGTGSDRPTKNAVVYAIADNTSVQAATAAAAETATPPAATEQTATEQTATKQSTAEQSAPVAAATAATAADRHEPRMLRTAGCRRTFREEPAGHPRADREKSPMRCAAGQRGTVRQEA